MCCEPVIGPRFVTLCEMERTCNLAIPCVESGADRLYRSRNTPKQQESSMRPPKVAPKGRGSVWAGHSESGSGVSYLCIARHFFPRTTGGFLAVRENLWAKVTRIGRGWHPFFMISVSVVSRCGSRAVRPIHWEGTLCLWKLGAPRALMPPHCLPHSLG